MTTKPFANKFPACCATCRQGVETGAGYTSRVSDKWSTIHKGCGTPCANCGGKTSSRGAEVLCRACNNLLDSSVELDDAMDMMRGPAHITRAIAGKAWLNAQRERRAYEARQAANTGADAEADLENEMMRRTA
jgi:hypothetical protein